MTLRLPVLVVALWWGSLTTIGFLVVPLLFAHLPSPALAGGMVARLFAAQTWVSVACCMVLLMISRPKGSVTPYPWARSSYYFYSEWIAAGAGVTVWRGATHRGPAGSAPVAYPGTVLYLVQWCCALVVLWRTLP